MKKYDLHCHSQASDGTLTPAELILRASQQGINVIALTDHDTIDGIPQAREQADQLNIQLITGVEISTQWQNRSIHIVGLGFDENNQALLQLLQQQKIARLNRAIAIGEKLEKLGIENAFEGAKSFATGEVTRAHYARYLVKSNQVSNPEQAFKRYLSEGKPAFVKLEWENIENTIQSIHQAGGVAVIAHPLRYQMSNKWIKRLITDFKQWGGDAIEVAGCGQSLNQRELLARWAKEFELAGSVGSDFHFPCGWIELGKNLIIPPEIKPVWQLL